MASQTVPVEKRIRMSLLIEIYGELLTEKQRTFLRRYYDEDYSFGEIAREFGVSRQAIFDSVKHGEATLENYESVLNLVRRRQDAMRGVSGESLNEAARTISQHAGQLRELAGQLRSHGLNGNSAEVATQLESMTEQFNRAVEKIEDFMDGALHESGSDGETAEVGVGNGSSLFGRRGPEVD